MTYEYDEFADVMWVSLCEPQLPCVYVEGTSGAVLRVEERTGRICGYRIPGWQKKLGEGAIVVPEINDPHFVQDWITSHHQ